MSKNEDNNGTNGEKPPLYRVNKRLFARFARDIQKAHGTSAEASMEVARLYREAANNAGVHRGAFKLALKLQRQDPAKVADFLRAFDTYRGLLGIDAQGDMLEEVDEDKGATKAAAAAGKSTAKGGEAKLAEVGPVKPTAAKGKPKQAGTAQPSA